MSYQLLVKTIVAAFVLLSFSVNAQKPAISKDVEKKIKQVENNLGGSILLEGYDNTWNLMERMKHYKVNGLSIAVVHNYKLEWARGYGWADSAAGTPVTTETLFQAASISKSINGVGVLKLVQDHKINLDADINTYLKSWKFPYDSVSKGKKITVANLLSHTAGLTIHGFPGYERDAPVPSLQQILDGKPPANTKAVRSQHEPGLKYEYSGGGTTITQLIVQDVTGQAYEVYMQENVLKPMQMTASSYSQTPPKGKEKLLATGYDFRGAPVRMKYHIYPEQAPAGLWTNPTELSKYIIETQLSLQGKSSKVLSKEMTWRRLTPYIDKRAALGVFIDTRGGIKYFGHEGWNVGFTSRYIGSFEEGNGIVIMTNSDNSRILDEIVNSVAKVYGWKDYHTPAAKKIATNIPDSLVNKYVGNYIFFGDTATVTRNGNKMILSINNDEFFEMYFTSADEFVTQDMPYTFRFVNEGGKISEFYFEENGEKISVRRL